MGHWFPTASLSWKEGISWTSLQGRSGSSSPSLYGSLSELYKLGVVRGFGWDSVILGFVLGLWVVGWILPHPVPGLPHPGPHWKPWFLQRCPCLGICGKSGNNTTKLFCTFCTFYLVLCILCLFSVLSLLCVWVIVLVMQGPWRTSQIITGVCPDSWILMCWVVGHNLLKCQHWVSCWGDWLTLQLYWLSWVLGSSLLWGVSV